MSMYLLLSRCKEAQFQRQRQQQNSAQRQAEKERAAKHTHTHNHNGDRPVHTWRKGVVMIAWCGLCCPFLLILGLGVAAVPKRAVWVWLHCVLREKVGKGIVSKIIAHGTKAEEISV